MGFCDFSPKFPGFTKDFGVENVKVKVQSNFVVVKRTKVVRVNLHSK